MLPLPVRILAASFSVLRRETAPWLSEAPNFFNVSRRSTRQSHVSASPAGSKEGTDCDPRPQMSCKENLGSSLSLSLTRTLHQMNHAVMLPRLLLFYSASLLLLAGLDVRHQEQGAKSAVACVLYLRLDNHRGTLRQ